MKRILTRIGVGGGDATAVAVAVGGTELVLRVTVIESKST